MYKSKIYLDIPVAYSSYVNSHLSDNYLNSKIHEILLLQDHLFEVYLGFDNLKLNKKVYIDKSLSNMVHVNLNCDVYYKTIVPAEIILVKIIDFDEKGHAIGAYFDKKVFIHKSQIGEDVRLKIINNIKSLNIGTKMLKLNDVVKVKVINILKDKFYNLKINASMRGLTYGKLAWFK